MISVWNLLVSTRFQFSMSLNLRLMFFLLILNTLKVQRFKFETTMKHLDNLDEYIQKCEIEIIKRYVSYIDTIKHITQLPEISLISAMIISSEIDFDMNQW